MMANMTVTATVDPAFSADDSALALAQAAVRAAEDRKGSAIRLLRVSEVSYLADYFVVVTGFSAVQVRAIARSVEATVAAELGRSPQHTEGEGDGRWVLQDYGDVIIHIFMPEEREFYGLEAFWGHAEEIPVAKSLPNQSLPTQSLPT